jgi:DNA-binding NarL/FixJ family response regulator
VSEPITLVVADDHALLREMLAQRLQSEPDLRVLASVGNAREALEAWLEWHPRVLLLDIDMPGPSVFDVAATIREKDAGLRLIFLSGFCHDHYIDMAIQLRASAYISKREPVEAVISAIRAAVAGRVRFSPEVQERIVVDRSGVRLARRPEARVGLLTPRELTILGYIAKGHAKKEMARLCGISVKTVEQHCTHIMDKLEIHDRVELARFAIREGVVEP